MLPSEAGPYNNREESQTFSRELILLEIARKAPDAARHQNTVLTAVG